MTTDTETRTPVQRAAVEAVEHFSWNTRDDGSTYWSTDLTADPEHWITRLCMDAHGDMLPYDERYRFIVRALNDIADAEDIDDARDAIEADVYTHDLLRWLASSLDRICYVDEAVSEYGAESFSDDMPRSGFDLTKAIAMGQIAERTEVFDSVLSSLEARAEDFADEDEGGDDGDA